jgi:hemerythrin superfamily protein
MLYNTIRQVLLREERLVKSISGLVSRMKEDHDSICSSIRMIISSKGTLDEKYQKARSIKEDLIEHLTMEDEDLYPLLKNIKTSFFNSEFVENSLEMKKIALDLIELLNKYSAYKNKAAFEKELSDLLMSLSNRFKTEEHFFDKLAGA